MFNGGAASCSFFLPFIIFIGIRSSIKKKELMTIVMAKLRGGTRMHRRERAQGLCKALHNKCKLV